MPVSVDLSSNSSVRIICADEDHTACAYLANLYIPVFSLDSGKVVHTYDVHNQIVGLQLRPEKKNALYAIDDSFGMHVFDLRTNQRNKKRLNPEVENHNVVCTALSSSHVLAVSSSEFGGGILDVRGSRRREHHPHAVTLFDIRYAGEPLTTYAKKHGSEVTSMEFYKNGHDLLTGDMNGALKAFNTQLRDEDNACRWERWMKGPITKVGVINKRIVYGIGNRSEATVFVDNAKGALETLYGSVQESANKAITKTSKAFYKKPEWCLGLMKGVNDDLPLVAVHGVQNEQFISLTAMDQKGVRQEKPLLSYAGHTGEVKCMTVTSKLLLTGGEDGKVVIQYSDFKHPQFAKDAIVDHRLTLNRGNLSDKHDQGEDEDEPETEPEHVGKRESSDSDSDADESDSDEPSAKKKHSRAAPSSSTAPSTSSAPSSSTSQHPKRSESEERRIAHYLHENSAAAKRERNRKLRKEQNRQKRKRQESEGWETVSEDEERLEIERKEKEEEKKKQELIAAGKYVPPPPKDKKKKKKSTSSPQKAKKDKDEDVSKKESLSKKDKAGPSAPVSSKKESKEESKKESKEEPKKESKEERVARKEREAKEARKIAKQEKEAEEERKAKEEREKRRAMKLAETKEERAARKDRERKEREREERKKEERKKAEKKKEESKKEDRKKEVTKRSKDGESSSGAPESKKSKNK